KTLLILPNFLTFILILMMAVVFGMALKWIFSKFFKIISIDTFFQRLGTVELLRKGGIKDPVSSLLAKLIGWIVFIIFAIMSLGALETTAVEKLLEKFLLYLPNVFVALLILLFGYLLSNFFGRAALIASVNAGIKVSGLIGKAVTLTVFMLSATMALEQLGIGRETVVIAFAIVFGGIVFSFSLAFGLGGKDIAKDYLVKKIKGEEKNDDISHL
ncbi:MAG: hypothetical protein VST72_01525, partial [Nitrospirota bacterium]|nr:hypothetical protein [Nitrospirota bacterium]